MRNIKILTSDSSGQRELPKDARPRGVVVYNLVSSLHSRNFLWHNHRSESCADFTTSSKGFVELRRVHRTYRLISLAVWTIPPATTSSIAWVIPFLSSDKQEWSGGQLSLRSDNILLVSSGLQISTCYVICILLLMNWFNNKKKWIDFFLQTLLK